MQFSIVALLSIVALAVAAPAPAPIQARTPQVNAEAAAMTDATGNVVPFNAAEVPTRK